MSPFVLQQLSIHDIDLDTENPRIRRFLQIYESENVTDDQISLALDVAGEESTEAGLKDATTPAKLRASIVANGGIRQPITVNRESNGKLVCIEGNTRLWIYRSLHTNKAKGNWDTIPCLVYEHLKDDDIDSIRLQAHIVGPRPWDAYSKAKYLWELQNKEMMPLNRIIELCGGSKRDVQTAIQAYADMEAFYRPLCLHDDFDAGRYSGFVEFQKNKVKQAVLLSGHDTSDFGRWIYDRRIDALREVRHLPQILKDANARKVFLKSGVKAALELIDKPDVGADLGTATFDELLKEVTIRASRVSMEELRTFQRDATCRTPDYIDDAVDALSFLLNQIREN